MLPLAVHNVWVLLDITIRSHSPQRDFKSPGNDSASLVESGDL